MKPQRKAASCRIYTLLSLQYPEKMKMYLIEAETVPEISENLEIAVVPTFVTLIGHRVVGRVEGGDPKEISKLVKGLADHVLSASDKLPETVFENSEKLKLGKKLEKLIYYAPVMLFMKGSPGEPKCGFSRQTVELLTKHDIPFASFDILTDDEVRSGLKEYSDWPTYPQLYAKGNFMGGLDILKEMVSSGEDLKNQLGISDLQVPGSSVAMEEPGVSIEERLTALVKSATVLVFIKGTPDAPRCGFSRTIVQLLKDRQVEFSTFDILEDEEVRAGLKEFSQWPTYPQLYAKGVFMGGLDIIKEMSESTISLQEQFGL